MEVRKSSIEWVESLHSQDDRDAWASMMWLGYPSLTNAIDSRLDESARQRYEAKHLLNNAHIEAMEHLTVLCSNAGIDGSALVFAGSVCRELFRDPEKYNIAWHTDSTAKSEEWPNILRAARFTLSQSVQVAIRDGEAAFVRLSASLSIQADQPIILANRPLSEGDVQTAGLLFFPGGFIYREIEIELTGKPLLVLKALANDRHKTRTLKQLRDAAEIDLASDDAIKQHVLAARKALALAMKKAGVKRPKNRPQGYPIPTVERGPNRTAWKLDLP